MYKGVLLKTTIWLSWIQHIFYPLQIRKRKIPTSKWTMYLLSFCFFLFLIFILIINQFSNEIHNNIQQDFFSFIQRRNFKVRYTNDTKKHSVLKMRELLPQRPKSIFLEKNFSLHNLAYASKKISKNLNF